MAITNQDDQSTTTTTVPGKTTIKQGKYGPIIIRPTTTTTSIKPIQVGTPVTTTTLPSSNVEVKQGKYGPVISSKSKIGQGAAPSPTEITATYVPPTPKFGTTTDLTLEAAQKLSDTAAKAQKEAGISPAVVQQVVEQQPAPVLGRVEPEGEGIGKRILRGVFTNPLVKYGVVKPLEFVDVGRRVVIGAISSDISIKDAIKDPTLQSKDVFNYDFGNWWGSGVAEWTAGLATDILLDPVTYLTFGTGGLVKEAAEQATRAGVRASTRATIRQTSRALEREVAEAGTKAAAQAAEQASREFLTGEARDTLIRVAREDAEEAVRSTARLVEAGTPSVTRGATEGLTAAQQEAVSTLRRAQRVGPRRVLGARSREELAQGAREIREAAIESGNRFVQATLTDDVISDLATRGYSAARGNVAEALGLRGGIRIGVPFARRTNIVVPIDALTDSFGTFLTSARVGGMKLNVPMINKSFNVLGKGLMGSKYGNAIMRTITPIGEGGLFGSEDILRMRTALRTGRYQGEKLAGETGADFVKMLAMDRAFRTLKNEASTSTQTLLRQALENPNFFRYSNSVTDLLENPRVILSETQAFHIGASAYEAAQRAAGKPISMAEREAAGVAARNAFSDTNPETLLENIQAAVGRNVSPQELEVALQLRQASDELYERANYINQRARTAGGEPIDTLADLPYNQAWFPRVLSDNARTALSRGDEQVAQVVREVGGIDRSFALAGANLRNLKVGSRFFGKILQESDMTVKRLNEIARQGGFKGDFFESNVETAFQKFAGGYSRDIAYSEWLYNMSLASEELMRRGGEFVEALADPTLRGPFGVAQAIGAGGRFAGKGFGGEIVQQPLKTVVGVKAPRALDSFASAIDNVVTPERFAQLDAKPGLLESMTEVRNQINQLGERLAASTGKKRDLVFVNYVEDTLDDVNERLLRLERSLTDEQLTPGVGPALGSEADALLQSLKNEAAGLKLIVDDIQPEQWTRIVPDVLNSSAAFLQLNSRRYPGLLASPEIEGMIKNFRRLEDPAFAKFTQFLFGRLTRSFKAWATGNPAFHARNALSNTFFMLAAGADPITLTRATKLYNKFADFMRTATPSTVGEVSYAAGEVATRAGAFAARGATDIPFAGVNKTLQDFLGSPAFYKEVGISERTALRLAAGEFDVLGTLPAKKQKEVTDIIFSLAYAQEAASFGIIDDLLEGSKRLGVFGGPTTATVRGGLGTTGVDVARGAAASASRALGKPLVWSRKAGNAIESWSRFALTYDGLAKGLSPEGAAARTAKYLVDYSDLSLLDKSIKQIIPFWMWMSRSVPLIVETSWANPRAFATWNKIASNLEDRQGTRGPNELGVQEAFYLPPYMSTAFKLPIGRNVFGFPDFGYQKQPEAVGTFVDPVRLLSSITPALRVPIETMMNYSFNERGPLYDERYEEPGQARINYALESVFGPLLGYNRFAELPSAVVQNPATAGLAAAGAIGGSRLGIPAPIGAMIGGAVGAPIDIAMGEPERLIGGALTPQQELARQIELRGDINIPGTGYTVNVGQPKYIEEQYGTQSKEAARQAILRFLGVPYTEVQDYQQQIALDQIIKELESITARRQNQQKRR